MPAPLDLRGRSGLAFDERTGDVGAGEIAVQVGDASTWCRGVVEIDNVRAE